MKTYRSPRAAERAAAIVERDIPILRCKVDGCDLTVIGRASLLRPSELDRLAELGLTLTEPGGPDPSKPLLKKNPSPAPCESPSKAENPTKVCDQIFQEAFDNDRIDQRTELIEKAIFEGVNPSTAKTYYARFRKEKGLPGLRASRKARMKRTAKENWTAPPPSPQRTQNGIREPLPETITAEVWEVADLITKQKKRPARRREVIAKLPYINPNSAIKYFKWWRKFHGHPVMRGKDPIT